MIRSLLAAALFVAAPCMADDAPIIALDAADEATCAQGCARISKAALDVIAARMRRADELEVLAQRLANEVAKKPGVKYCL